MDVAWQFNNYIIPFDPPFKECYDLELGAGSWLYFEEDQRMRLPDNCYVYMVQLELPEGYSVDLGMIVVDWDNLKARPY